MAKVKTVSGLWEIGQPYFIRTITHHLTGRLVEVTDHELWLEDAAWIADDGRFAQAVEEGEFSEVEPFPSGLTVAVGRGSLIDAVKITAVPRSQK
jgi:hypothetical protein